MATKLIDVQPGDALIADAGFTCVKPGRVSVKKSDNGLYFDCSEGRHYLDGQVNDEGSLVGLRRID